ncbi:MAG: pyridoxine 5'-phosphate synthase [Phycisphaerales bacterium]|jgi:pyridoxine 5-phosphate synthase|nr:pyridoxine 5'-phosphate synthase [Phycisphaerales bacterium]
MVKLCVNIDHVATIREARKTYEPNPVLAAAEAELGGADGITLHIREDRRHMQEYDLANLRSSVGTPLNLEMAATDAMVDLAIKTMPEMVMLVPEGRDEITTEGGLDICGDFDRIQRIVGVLHRENLRVSAFIDAEIEQINAAKNAGCDVCEIHTGPYAESIEKNGFSITHEEVATQRSRVQNSASHVQSLGMQCNAGHGLNYLNVGGIAAIPGICELHIGHAIVSRSIFVGMKRAVEVMKEHIQEATT